MLNIFLKYLIVNGHQDETNNFKESYLSHPNYPSVYSATDTLDLLGIENIAVNVDKEMINKLPDSFIAEIVQEGKNQFIVVEKTGNNNIDYYDDTLSRNSLRLDEFQSIWTSKMIAIEPNRNPNTFRSSKATLTKWILLPVLILFALVMIFLSEFQFNVLTVINSILISTGLFLSLVIVDKKYNSHSLNTVSNNICSLSKKNKSCDEVLNSSVINIRGVEFSDFPILFFMTLYLAILIDKNVLSTIGLVSILVLPVVLISIYLQKYKLKVICPLCISIAGIIIINALIGIVQTPMDISFSNPEIVLSVVFLLVGTLWFSVKEKLKKSEHLSSQKSDLLQFKRRFEIFNFLSVETENPVYLKDLSGIPLNTKDNSKPVLRLFLSPSCGHCYTSYEEVRNLLKSHSEKLYCEIHFNLNSENDNNPYLQVVINLIKISSIRPDQAVDALDDWFIKKLSLKEWFSKWKLTEIKEPEIIGIIDEQYSWCRLNDFNFTPIKLLGNAKIPNEYAISEIPYFLNELIESKPNKFSGENFPKQLISTD